MEPISVGTAVCVGEVIDKAREEGKIVEATTTGTFMMPDGDKSYNTFLEMLRDQPMKADVAPLIVDDTEFEKLKEKYQSIDIHSKVGRFEELKAAGKTFNEAHRISYAETVSNVDTNPVDLMSMAVSEDAGFPLDQMDAYDADFKKMYEDMFSRTSEMGVMGAGDFEARLAALQNELSNTKVENPNGGCIDLISSGGSSVHASQRPATPFCTDVPVFGAGAFVSIPEAGSYEGDAKVDDERSGTPVDA